MGNKIKFGFDSAQNSAGYLLWQVTMLWQRRIKKELDKLGITHTQFVLLSVLGWLSKSEESVTQVDIANHSNTDRMMVSKVLRTLEGKKLLKRLDHPTDTRAKVVMLTAEGEVVLQKAIIEVENVDASFFGNGNTACVEFQNLLERNSQ